MTVLLSTESANPALGNTLVTLVSFIILVVIVRRFVWGPLMKVLIEREMSIQDALSKAELATQESTATQREAQLALKDARQEATQLILQAKKQALSIQDTMLKATKEEIEQMRQAAQKEIDLERKRMLNDIKCEVTAVSIEIAEKILKREITSQDHQRLVEDFIQEMDAL